MNFEVIVVDFLSIVMETLAEETGEIGVVLQHRFADILANT
jgi:hypothetical protein